MAAESGEQDTVATYLAQIDSSRQKFDKLWNSDKTSIMGDREEFWRKHSEFNKTFGESQRKSQKILVWAERVKTGTTIVGGTMLMIASGGTMSVFLVTAYGTVTMSAGELVRLGYDINSGKDLSDAMLDFVKRNGMNALNVWNGAGAGMILNSSRVFLGNLVRGRLSTKAVSYTFHPTGGKAAFGRYKLKSLQGSKRFKSLHWAGQRVGTLKAWTPIPPMGDNTIIHRTPESYKSVKAEKKKEEDIVTETARVHHVVPEEKPLKESEVFEEKEDLDLIHSRNNLVATSETALTNQNEGSQVSSKKEVEEVIPSQIEESIKVVERVPAKTDEIEETKEMTSSESSDSSDTPENDPDLPASPNLGSAPDNKPDPDEDVPPVDPSAASRTGAVSEITVAKEEEIEEEAEDGPIPEEKDKKVSRKYAGLIERTRTEEETVDALLRDAELEIEKKCIE